MKYIEISVERAKVFLTVEEITALLSTDKHLANQILLLNTTIFKEGLKRGKYFSRYEKQKKRELQKAFDNN
ncbi:hypothetical protein [Peribacillus frigoritolerans]|uniref:hypothetical protein n=1 Tax=Peribacillus frigoritolerans TaxID=450367 RepID=UPI003CFFD92C